MKDRANRIQYNTVKKQKNTQRNLGESLTLLYSNQNIDNVNRMFIQTL